MSRKVYKIKELDLLERWGYKYIASVANNYYATTYYKLRAISDLQMCGGVVKDCPAVIASEGGISWSNTIMASDTRKVITTLLALEGEMDGLEKI